MAHRLAQPRLRELRTITVAALLAALAWTLVIGASLAWNYWHEEELEEIARSRYDRPEVWVQFIEMEENHHERQAFIQYWRGKNVGVKVRRKLSWGGYIKSSKIEAMTEERIPCPWIMNLIHILWDGQICRCTGDHECNYPMGNVYESAIKEIWGGPLKRERKTHLSRRFDQLNEQFQNCLDWKVGAAERYV